MRINFGEAGGGTVEFADVDALLLHIDKEVIAWDNDPTLKLHARERRPGQPRVDHTSAFVGNWRHLRSHITSLNAQNPRNQAWLADQVNQSIRVRPVMAHTSAESRVVLDMLVSSSFAEAEAAARFLSAFDDTPLFDAMSKAQLTGALDGWARTRHFDTKSAANARAGVRRTLEQIEARTAEYKDMTEAHSVDLRKRLDAADAKLAQQREEFQLFARQSEDAIGADRSRWQSEWTAKYNVYVEQLKLRAAVHQWSERATAHEVSFISRRNWTIGLGLGGLAGAICWSTLSLWLAKWLFVGAFVEGTLKAKEGFLRPTWSHELIFGAAATVLYLTLFLWTMRILVRMMMSEHHLGVDARSRESMAHTYLALLEDKGATSNEDRAIVLAALFRPITDGLVKDDALPMISPAAFLSGGLAGK